MISDFFHYHTLKPKVTEWFFENKKNTFKKCKMFKDIKKLKNRIVCAVHIWDQVWKLTVLTSDVTKPMHLKATQR